MFYKCTRCLVTMNAFWQERERWIWPLGDEDQIRRNLPVFLSVLVSPFAHSRVTLELPEW